MRSASPKSYSMLPGITVSKSMTQTAFPLTWSNRMLLILVSLWVTRTGIRPSSMPFTTVSAQEAFSSANSISRFTLSARPALSSRMASRSAWTRLGV